MPTDPPWESRTRIGRWAHCEAMPDGKTYLFRITDESLGEVLTAECTLTEMMSLRAWIGNSARQRTTQARFHSGT